MKSRFDKTALRQVPSLLIVSLLLSLPVLSVACGGANVSSNTAATEMIPPQTSWVIADSVLATAEPTVRYIASLTGIGGVKPYHRSLANGTLPAGIQIVAASGVINGVTNHSGSYSFTVRL